MFVSSLNTTLILCRQYIVLDEKICYVSILRYTIISWNLFSWHYSKIVNFRNNDSENLFLNCNTRRLWMIMHYCPGWWLAPTKSHFTSRKVLSSLKRTQLSPTNTTSSETSLCTSLTAISRGTTSTSKDQYMYLL